MNNTAPNTMFAKFDQALGKTTPTTTAAPVSTRADEVRNLAKQAQEIKDNPPVTGYHTTQSSAGIFSNVPKNYVKGFVSRYVDDIKHAGSNVDDAIIGTGQYDGDNPITRGFEATGEAFSAIPKVVLDLLPKAARVEFDKLNSSHVIWDKMQDILSPKIVQDFITNHPDAANFLKQSAKIGGSSGTIAGTILGAEGASNLVQKGVNSIPKTEGPVSINEPSIPKSSANSSESIQKIKETISPKPTSKEAKLALDQGRLIKGQEPTMFKSGTPDQIATSDQQLKSTMTINRLIPDAAKMDEPTLHSALDEKITETAKSLEPEMKATPINKETVGKITKDWESLKKSEIENADANDEANVLKSQKQFETRLQKSNSGNMNDLWNTAKEYDASVPDNVKQANSMSSESLQNKKSLWLDRRAILRDAIKDTKNGLGKSAQQGFSDMTDMYEGKNGIMSKAKVETKVAPSKIKQAYDSKTGKAIRTVAKVGLGVEGLKKISGF